MSDQSQAAASVETSAQDGPCREACACGNDCRCGDACACADGKPC